MNEFANLRIMTYNIWFDQHNNRSRYAHIIKIILESNANVVCLQECTNQFLSLLTENKSITDKYKHFGVQDFKTFYGVIILS